MQFSVQFGPNGARIIKGVLKADKNTLVNPSLQAVKGVPPHQWRLVGGRIVPSIGAIRAQPLKPSSTLWHWVVPVVLSTATHFLLHFLGV